MNEQQRQALLRSNEKLMFSRCRKMAVDLKPLFRGEDFRLDVAEMFENVSERLKQEAQRLRSQLEKDNQEIEEFRSFRQKGDPLVLSSSERSREVKLIGEAGSNSARRGKA